VVTAGRAHLGGPPCHRLAEQLGEVGRHRATGACRLGSPAGGELAVAPGATRQILAALVFDRGGVAVGARQAAKPVRRPGQAVDRDHAHAGHQGGFRRVLLGHHDCAEPFLCRPGHRGQHAADRPQLAVEA
jgi:hypothetical protein